MNRHVVWAVCVLATASCGRKDDVQVQSQPGLLDSEGKTRKVTPVAQKPPPAAPAPEPSFADDYRPRPEPAPAQAAVADAEAEPDATPPRDLSAELSSAMARVTSCVDLPAAAAQKEGRLVIAASAIVLGSGHVSRATITAPGQPPAAIACMQREVQGVVLKDGIPAAPLSVQGTTELTVRPARSQLTADAAVPSPIPVAPTIPVMPINPDIARPQADDIARPDPPDLAGPP